jgi:hypothetical protein
MRALEAGRKQMGGKYLGTLLMERGVLDRQQVDAILARQRQTGQPFGQMAVVMYNVRMADVWRSLATQGSAATPRVNLDEVAMPERAALDLIPSRLAWASKVLPLRLIGERLVCATTQRQLCDAVALLHEKLDRPIEFVVVEELQLKQRIMECYPV